VARSTAASFLWPLTALGRPPRSTLRLAVEDHHLAGEDGVADLSGEPPTPIWSVAAATCLVSRVDYPLGTRVEHRQVGDRAWPQRSTLSSANPGAAMAVPVEPGDPGRLPTKDADQVLHRHGRSVTRRPPTG